MAEQKMLGLTADIHQYLVSHGTPPDTIAQELIEVTREKIGAMAIMQVAPEQGTFMTVLTKLIGARSRAWVGIASWVPTPHLQMGKPDDGLSPVEERAWSSPIWS